MSKISFSLLKPRSDKDTAIIVRYPAADGRLKYYTGESIHPSKWNNGAPLDKGTGAILRRITSTILEMAVDCKIKGQPLTRALLSGRLDTVLDRRTVRADLTVFPAFDQVIDGMRSGAVLTPKNERYAHGTIRVTQHHATILKAFCPSMRFDQIDMPMYYRFVSWCHTKDYSRNFIGTIIKNWKTLLRVTRGAYHDNDIYEHREFKRLQEDTTGIYLTDLEIAHLYAHRVTPRQEVARDWFVLGCYLGLRVNDLVALDKKNLQKGFVTVVNEKTDTKVVVPVHPVAGRILKRWKGFPPAITDVELNRVIKDVARAAQMNDQVIHSITKGGRRQDTYSEKWARITSHTMRRSAITNLLKAGVPEAIVMKLVGMKSYGTLKKYNRMTAEDAGQIAAGLDYFKK